MKKNGPFVFEYDNKPKIDEFLTNSVDNKKINQLIEKLEKLTTKISKQNKDGKRIKDLDVNKFAFVKFNDQNLPDQIREDYRKHYKCKKFWCGLELCGCCKIAEKYKFRGTHHIKLKRCRGEPSDIKWENLTVSKSNRFARYLFVFAIILFLMVLSILVTYLGKV
jgi:hypothetical protein